MSNWNNPGNNPGGGQGWGGGPQGPNPGQPPQGEPAQQGGWNPPPLSGLGQGQQGAQQPGWGQGPPQQGYPQQGYGQQPYGGFQQGPGGPGGPGVPPVKPKKSNATIIGIVVVGVAVLAVAGLLIALLSPKAGDGPDITPTPPPPAPPTSSPTASSTPAAPTRTRAPSSGSEESVGNGLTMKVPSGWKVVSTGKSTVLKDSQGRLFLVITGKSSDPSTDIVTVTDSITSQGSNAKKTPVEKPPLGSGLSAAKQAATFTMADGSGTANLGVVTIMVARDSDNIGFAGSLIAPATDFSAGNELATDASTMLNSLVESLRG